MSPVTLTVNKVARGDGTYEYEIPGADGGLDDLLDRVSSDARHALAGTRMTVIVSSSQFLYMGVDACRLRIDGKGSVLWPADNPVKEIEIDLGALEAMGVERAVMDSLDDVVPCSRWIVVHVPKPVIPQHVSRVRVRKTNLCGNYMIMSGVARGVILCGDLEILFPALPDMPPDHTFDLLVSKESVEGWHQLDIDIFANGCVEALCFDTPLEPRLQEALDARSVSCRYVPCSRWLQMDACVPAVDKPEEPTNPIRTFRIMKDGGLFGSWNVDNTSLQLCSDIEQIFPELKHCCLGCQVDIRISLKYADGYTRCHIDRAQFLTCGEHSNIYVPCAVLQSLGVMNEKCDFKPVDIWLRAALVGER